MFRKKKEEEKEEKKSFWTKPIGEQLRSAEEKEKGRAVERIDRISRFWDSWFLEEGLSEHD